MFFLESALEFPNFPRTEDAGEWRTLAQPASLLVSALQHGDDVLQGLEQNDGPFPPPAAFRAVPLCQVASRNVQQRRIAAKALE
jgi:hypothetical protein